MKQFAYVLMVALAVTSLTACSKKGSTRADGAAGAGGVAGSASGDGTSAYGGAAGANGSSFGSGGLNDPSSPLSKRRVHFEYDSYVLSAEYRPIVEAHAQYLAQHPGAAMTLEGHGDERGSREYNIALGERRAQAVQQIMTALGASPRQVTTVSFGEEKPLAECHEESCWWQNRRVEIVYTAQ